MGAKGCRGRGRRGHGGGGKAVMGRGAHLEHRDLEGLLQLVQGGGCQAAAAAPDEAQGRGPVGRVVLAGPSQQHLYAMPCIHAHNTAVHEHTPSGACTPCFMGGGGRLGFRVQVQSSYKSFSLARVHRLGCPGGLKLGNSRLWQRLQRCRPQGVNRRE